MEQQQINKTWLPRVQRCWDVISEGDFRIEGNIKGNIKTSGKIVVGKTGVINGSLEGENADFEGGFSGKLKLSGMLTLRSSAYIEGE